MNEECPNLAGCPMFKYLLADLSRETFVLLFCRDRFWECARKKLKDAGKPVPEQMLPTGEYL